MEPQDLRAVQALVLRAPHGPAVAHLVLTIPDVENAGSLALGVLARENASFGVQASSSPCCSIGFSFAGLERLGLPQGYLRLFRRLAPAFTAGANLRAGHCGDGFANASDRPWPELAHERAHVLLTWHGDPSQTEARAKALDQQWRTAFNGVQTGLAGFHAGRRLGAPPQRQGEWVHFGYRDGLSEVCIDRAYPQPMAPDQRDHEPGVLLLGHVNDEGYNVFALGRAPDKVRGFFRNSSFGVLRPMEQDLVAFEAEIERWRAELSRLGGPQVSTAFVKAKLGGRWPGGSVLRPGATDEPAQESLKLDLSDDDQGLGCPFGSHVRRMRAGPDRYGRVFERPLQRRSLPYGAAEWSGEPIDEAGRGLLGHFFCAGIEEQFEHLMGQWAARPPLGLGAGDNAPDPLIGPHADLDAALAVPLPGRRPQPLKGFLPWTKTLGTLYAWHPSRCALQALLQRDYEPDDQEGPWL